MEADRTAEEHEALLRGLANEPLSKEDSATLRDLMAEATPEPVKRYGNSWGPGPREWGEPGFAAVPGPYDYREPNELLRAEQAHEWQGQKEADPSLADPDTVVLAVCIADLQSPVPIVAVKQSLELLTSGDPMFGEESQHEARYTILHAELLPAGTAWPKAARAVCAAATKCYRHYPAADSYCLVNSVAFGSPALKYIQKRINPLFSTSAVAVNLSDTGDEEILHRAQSTVGAAWLIGRLQIVADEGRLDVPDEDGTLVNEALDGLDSYIVEESRPDLLRALALATANEYAAVTYTPTADLPSL
jgi:hypothetical protein